MKSGTRLPEFLCIGTQKGGTTTLHEILRRHDELYLPKQKELHYFSEEYCRGLEWYRSHFQDAREDQVCGEITPYYMFHKEAASRIKEVLPSVKILVLLRDPVERALSQYFHARRHGFETLSLETALLKEEERLALGGIYSNQKHSYLSRSRYIEQLERFEDLFGKKRMLVVRSEDLFSGKDEWWERVQSFLDIKRIPLPGEIAIANGGRGESSYVEEKTRLWLQERLSYTKKEVGIRYGITW